MTRGTHTPRVCVLADDLSGAAECAVEWVLRGHPAQLHLHPGEPQAAGAVVLDLDCRDHGAPVIADGVQRVFAQAPLAYLKVDSLLRGAWAPLVAALVAATGRKALLCPALPRLGRCVRGGRVVLTAQESARLGGSPPFGGDIVERLRACGLSATGIGPLQGEADDHRVLGAAWQRHDVVVADATSPADLARLAAALADEGLTAFAAGSAGLAGAIAQHDAGDVLIDAPHGAAALPAPMAFVVGSDSRTAHEQLEVVASATRATIQRWWPGIAREPARAGADRLYAIATGTTDAAGRALADGFARWTLPALAGARTVVATGGDTARALCAAAGVDVLQVQGQVEPGVCVATAELAGGPLHLVIKSGTFGDRETLLRIARSSSARFDPMETVS